MDSINNLIVNDLNYQHYKNKIKGLIDDNNIEQLTKEIVWKPNIVLSMIKANKVTRYEKSAMPFLGVINNNPKLSQFYFACLIHFGQRLLNEKQIVGSYIHKYLNNSDWKRHITAVSFVKFNLFE